MNLRGFAAKTLAFFAAPALAFTCCAAAWGQAGTGSGAAPCKCAPRKPMPYTAEFKTTTVQTLADGTTITRVATETQARDSEGRSMTSRTQSPFGEGQPSFTFGNANDPVAGTTTNWNSQTRKATVVQFPPGDQRHGCWRSDSGHMTINYGPVRPRTAGAAGRVASSVAGAILPNGQTMLRDRKTEDLGTTTIMGVEAHGRRTTVITPAGAVGNDRPLVRTTEIWIASNPGIVLREVIDDPRMGKTTREVTSLDLGEPDMATFQPPDGYTVVTEEMHQVDCQY